MTDTDPIYRSRSFTKNGKHYWLEEAAWIFDCPHCETARDHFSRENALTHMDMHFMKVHPEAHIPLCSPDVKEKVGQWYREFRMRSHAPLGTIRPPAFTGIKTIKDISTGDQRFKESPEYQRLLAAELEVQKQFATRN